mmetsp:Transcript_1030/g.2516  ORF Transcript_1030/g.2516 Transcript_1030/m.2516 type:complete len:111 (-) Transcript_1030:4915-5247(-)
MPVNLSLVDLNMAGIGHNLAPVNSVDANVSNGTLNVAISGYLPDPSYSLEAPTYRVEGNVITAELTMHHEDCMAACVIVDYNTSLSVDLHDKAPGDYRVSVNGVEASFSI